MHYIIVTQLESTNPTSVKIKGLPAAVVERLKESLLNRNVFSNVKENFFEADMEGYEMLNLLAAQNFKICGQSMVIEKTNIGGRTVQILNLTWTLEKTS